ncbi:MAG: thiamine diphosphokinase [Clostridia bacterium]|nr:thiamine diphosphokinase [Clostridia bacterium]
MRCFVFCSAQIDSYDFLKSFDFEKSFIICADGGYKHTQKLGLVPDLWIGDGDSLKNGHIAAKEIIAFPPQKDNTDTDLAVMEALRRGYKDIIILGALGGRLDHEYSHFCLLKKILDNGGRGTLLDSDNEITMENKRFSVFPDDKKYISFFPFGGDVNDFCVKGLYYETENMHLVSGEVQASSNCFVDEKIGEISFSSGYILVIRSNDSKEG